VLRVGEGDDVTAGRIVETEAYLGPGDLASHAAFRPASRPLFYGEGGIAYVFRAYGLHHCLNAITGSAGEPGCVLIRALAPVAGHALMVARRGVAADSPRLASGPGNVTRALGIQHGDTGADLSRGRLRIEPAPDARTFRIAVGRRIGINRSVHLPLRFWIAGDPHVSRGSPVIGSASPGSRSPHPKRAVTGLASRSDVRQPIPRGEDGHADPGVSFLETSRNFGSLPPKC
jgi:DNA-3-methyladenine glycosylase